MFSNIKNKKDLLTGSLLNNSFSLDNSTYGYEIKEGKLGFNIDIWKHEEDTYKEIKESDVINKYKAYLIKNGIFINDLSELLDEEENLKECFNRIFEKNNIYYDIDECKFYDHSKRISKKLLYLIPERYLREIEIETIDLETFKTENDHLINGIKSGLKELFEGL